MSCDLFKFSFQSFQSLCTVIWIYPMNVPSGSVWDLENSLLFQFSMTLVCLLEIDLGMAPSDESKSS